MNSYRGSINYLYSLQRFGIKLGLKNISELLRRLNNPHKSLRFVHVAGTNGKGSIAAILSSILTEAGYTVGLYTSPHLVSFRERIKLNGKPIPKAEVIDSVREIKAKIKTGISPTYFEFTTCMAILYFAKKLVDIAILEVGMGGRLDATNVIQPLVTVISNVSLDHEVYLGNSLISIAKEKAGTIKRGAEVVTAERKPKVLAVIEGFCRKSSCSLYRVGRDIRERRVKVNSNTFHYFGLDRHLLNLEVGLRGRHQVVNASTALGVIEILMRKGYKVGNSAIYDGLKDVRWPGRLEVVQKDPLVILDGAHNPVAANCLIYAIKEFAFDNLILVIGVMKDKDINGILKRLVPLSDKVILTRPSYERAADPENMRKMAMPFQKDILISKKVDDAVRLALSLALKRDLICVTGSLYTVGEARRFLKCR
jgi:dihydrofolate synthase/folylpolyglutamate synthase